MHRRVKGVQTLIAAIGIGCLVFTGCNSQNEIEEPEPIKITMIHYIGEGGSQKVLEELVQDFNESQNAIQVRLHYIPPEDFQKEVALRIVDGDIPDVALVDCADFAYFNDMHPFVDLSMAIPELDQFMDQAKEPCTIDEKVKGFPLWVNCAVLYYNKAMLQEAGISIPQTPEEFTTAAKQLTTNQCYGVSFSSLREEAVSYYFLPFLWGKGIGVDNLDTEDAREVYETFHQLMLDDSLSEQTINMSGEDAAHQFGMGNAAMMINSSSCIETLQESHPNLNFDVTYLPTGGGPYSVIGGEIVGVLEGEHQEEALEFVQFIASEKRMQEGIDKTGLFAPRSDILETQYPGDEVEKHAKEIFEHATFREYTVEWPQISHVLTTSLRETISGERDTGVILTQAAEEIRKIREAAR